MSERNMETRKGYEYWDKLCAIPRHGFLLGPNNDRVIAAEGMGSWIDMYAAQRVAAEAQDEINRLKQQNAHLLSALKQTRHWLNHDAPSRSMAQLSIVSCAIEQVEGDQP